MDVVWEPSYVYKVKVTSRLKVFWSQMAWKCEMCLICVLEDKLEPCDFNRCVIKGMCQLVTAGDTSGLGTTMYFFILIQLFACDCHVLQYTMEEQNIAYVWYNLFAGKKLYLNSASFSCISYIFVKD